ncbi:MAG: hypothetical protein HY043_23310 [Verrucomicrobia bacterium]|nr:hypothetical protein [Verrucomicrobiota bacterium]
MKSKQFNIQWQEMDPGPQHMLLCRVEQGVARQFQMLLFRKAVNRASLPSAFRQLLAAAKLEPLI